MAMMESRDKKGVWKKADARVLGQIMAAQNIIFALPDLSHIAEFYAQALISVPGITSCHVCLGYMSAHAGETESRVCAECETYRKTAGGNDTVIQANPDFVCSLAYQPARHIINLDSYQHHFGFFVFKIENATVFDVYQPFINNLANYIGISLENRLQGNLLQKAHAELEHRVEERTAELKNANELLLHDIYERKLAEEKLHEASRYTRSLIEVSLDPLVTISPEGKIKDVNTATELVTGVSREHLIGSDFTEYFTEPEKAREGYQEVFKKGFVIDYPLAIRHVSGSIRDVLYNASVYKDAAGNVAGLFAAARDITERKRAERELILARDEALRANAVKSDFLSKMSHELRTPLNAVMGFSQILKMNGAGELNEKQERYVDNIYMSGKHLLGIISDILDMVKLESGENLPLSIELFPVSKVIDDTLIHVSEKASKKNIDIKKDLDPGLDIIPADKLRFKQILLVLLENSIKFGKPEGGTVTIEAEKAGDMAQFSVTDTGIGIREEDLGKLFELFHQVDSGTNRKYGGTGLGLAITKQLVEQHGGRIWAKSRYGEGSTFTFTLPLKALAFGGK
ncbi:MAG: ATP-binding protein [Candidatus Methanoperedens sp.]|nr:ATP-binding protein [Candidatus Methanoperedens sp.]